MSRSLGGCDVSGSWYECRFFFFVSSVLPLQLVLDLFALLSLSKEEFVCGLWKLPGGGPPDAGIGGFG